MRTTVCIPIYNQLQDSKGILALLRHNTTDESEFMVIDNGSSEPVEEFFLKYIKPKRFNYIRNEANIGMIKTMQQAYENCETEILIVIHNDVFIYQKDWDYQIRFAFDSFDDIGTIGLFGSQGVGQLGERYQDVPARLANRMAAGFSNMLEADIHGLRLESHYRDCAILDGFFMAFRMDLLRKTNGFDQRYLFHHFYDRDISLESLKHGYRNVVTNIPSHHLSGLTANRGDYQNWVTKQAPIALKNFDGNNLTGDQWAHDYNMKQFQEKWKDVLPLYVEDDATFRTGGMYDFKGDAIAHLSK